MSSMNINKLKNFDSVGAARESKVGKTSQPGSSTAPNTMAATGDDSLSFSTRFSEFGKILDSLRELPEVRRERVDALRARISSGEYNPSAEDIANAIFESEKV